MALAGGGFRHPDLDRQVGYRLTLLGAAFVGVALLLVIRLLFWQRQPLLVPPSAWGSPEIRPVRGAIWDRHGHLLALEVPRYQVIASPNIIQEPESVAQELAPLIGMPWQDILKQIGDKESWYKVLAPDVPSEIAYAVRDASIQGVGIEILPVRFYPMGRLACHVLGFVNAQNMAFYGIEQYYDTLLRGHKGNWGNGAVVSPEQFSAPVDGASLVLTIEWAVQKEAEQLLYEAIRTHDASGGSIIVVDPATGAILAMANWPGYDPNHYASSPPGAFLNPAISETYEPGSVIKAFLVAAALEEGLITPESTYHDTGCIPVMGVPLCNWGRRSHGLTTITQMLQHSLNVGAIHVVELLGPERFYRYLEEFGLAQVTGVDLANEVNGVIHHPGDSTWSELVLATNSYGQGMTATPLQVVMAMAAVANDGLLMQPYVVESKRWPDGHTETTQPMVVRRVISQPTAQTLTEMLVATVERGVQQARVSGYRVAGKTGTSQIPKPGGYDPDKSIATFVGFGSAEAPRFVILVKIDHTRAELASDVAAPVFQSLARWLFTYMGIPPS